MENDMTREEKIERLSKLLEEYEGCLPNRFYMNMGKAYPDKVAVHISYHDFSCTFHISLENDWDTIVTEAKKKVIQECGLLAQCHVQRFINERIWDIEDEKDREETLATLKDSIFYKGL